MSVFIGRGKVQRMAPSGAAASDPSEQDTGSRPRSGTRGRYDRTATPSERARTQRNKLLDAVRLTAAEGAEVTVARLLGHVGCGRNTFYEHFDDVTGALTQACSESAALLLHMLNAALIVERPRTPGDVITEVAAAWATWCAVDGGAHWGLLERCAGRRIDEVLNGAVAQVYVLLVAAGAASGVLAAPRADACSGALRAITRGVHERQQHEPRDKARAIADSCQDALTRLLR